MRVKLSSIVALLCIFLSIPFYHICRGNIMDNPKPEVETIDTYPEPEWAKVFFLGYDAFAADFLFTKAQYYFGSHYVTDKTYPFMEQMVEVIMALNPKLKFVIFFGEAVISSMGTPEAIDSAARLLDIGQKLYPEDYEFVFRKGYNYFFYLRDMERAYPLMLKGAKMKGAPKNLFWLVTKVATRGGGYRLGYAYTAEMYQAAKDKHMKMHFETRLKLFGDLITLTDISKRYHSEQGEWPGRDLKELLEKGYINEIPSEPYGGKYFFDSERQIVVTNSDLHKK